MKYHDLDRRVAEFIEYERILGGMSFNLQPFEIDPQTMAYLPATFTEITDVEIQSITPRFHVGNVYTFTAIPYKFPDPELLWVKGVKMNSYYYLWGKWMRGYMRGESREDIKKSADGVIRETITAAFPWLDEAEMRYLLASLICWKAEMRIKR